MFMSFYEHLKNDIRFRYILTGAINTFLGYATPLLIYSALCNYLSAFIISGLSTCICTIFSFVMYKIFVFKTKQNWRREFFRCNAVYGLLCLLCMLLIWVMVDVLHFDFWIAQLITTVVVIIFSYVGHKNFTFACKLTNKDR